MQEDNKESKVFATIKLPEIMTGMDERDFRKERKVKAQDYKKDLDIFNEQ
jgi:polyisoprenoid-binding protein YceI|tara:strand:+ start:42 stop:191 length:150 start_codon:yes stop_codon:yes gene_type:complete